MMNTLISISLLGKQMDFFFFFLTGVAERHIELMNVT